MPNTESRVKPMTHHTDTTKKGFETLIMRHMTGTDGLATVTAGIETPT